MKRLFTVMTAALAIALGAGAVSNVYKIYINPGHGGHDSDDRPTDLPTELGFTGSDRFYESDGTLTRGKYLNEFLQGLGYSTKMSRTTNYSSDDLALSTIAAQSNSFGGHFISLHSNGANASANYVIAEYSGTRTSNSTERVAGSQKFALAAAQQQDVNRLTDVTYSTPRAINDYSFNGWSLGVLASNTQVGYLVETWFHDYRPEALRMKGDVYNRFTAWQLARAYLEFPIVSPSAIKGCIIGDIRNTSKGCGYTSYVSRNRDSYLAVNGATVELLNSSGTVVQTMTTDKWHNGVYGFFDLTAGTYTIRVSKTGYQTQTATVTVSNGNSTLKKFNLVEGVNEGINTSTPSVNHGTVYVGSEDKRTVNVTTTGITGSIAVACTGDGFSVTPATLQPGSSTITVTFKPTKTGQHSGSVKLTSGSYSATVALSGEGKNPPLAFTEGWNMSETSGKKDANWLPAYSKARNMDFGGGKLYVVNAEDAKIAVVNAQTGAFIKDLDMTGVTGGALKVIDVKCFDGKVVACNLATTGSALKVYVWDNDNSQPRVLLNTTDFNGKARVGDCLGLYGNLTDGYIYFAAGSTTEQSEVLRYSISGGVCETAPSYVKPLKEDGDAGAAVKLGLSPRVVPDGAENFWAMGQQYYPTYFKDGLVYCSMNTDALGKVVHGNAFKSFNYRGTTYGVATTYASGSTTLTGGRAVVADVTNGWAQCDAVGSYPSGGLGTTRNTSMSTSVATHVNGDLGVEMWVLVHNQGLAYYKYGTVPVYDLDPDTVTRITVTPDKVEMGAVDYEATKTSTITVAGNNLKGDIRLSLEGRDAAMFSIDKTTITKAAAAGTVTVTYRPATVGAHQTTLVVASTGAEAVSVPVTGSMNPEPDVKGNFQRLGGLWYYHIPAGGTHEGENLIVLNDCKEQHGRAVKDPMLVRYLVERGQVWFWNYTTQKTAGKATAANLDGDGYVVSPANCYAMLFQNSAENETQGTGYTGTNVIDFSSLGTYGDDNGTAFEGVADLTGLGYFKNITVLGMSRAGFAQAGYDSYSTLTAADLSHNTALTAVDLGYNELVCIDLSRNTALTSVNCEGNGRTVVPDVATIGGLKTYFLPVAGLNGLLGDGFDSSRMMTASLKGGTLTQVDGADALKWTDDVLLYDYATGYTGSAIPAVAQFCLRGKASQKALKGDVNLDGLVDVADVNCVINVILSLDPADKYQGRADVNGSGIIDIDDLNTILNIVLGLN